ncbi:hypothetical protein GYMLUDRAFT_34517 [Collybiopsis luxurians FD-317 M1]|nr:hypothetical protein GYMLUDRAFT_34517 [Collybiopsis luxurians FD-317 M1]
MVATTRAQAKRAGFNSASPATPAAFKSRKQGVSTRRKGLGPAHQRPPVTPGGGPRPILKAAHGHGHTSPRMPKTPKSKKHRSPAKPRPSDSSSVTSSPRSQDSGMGWVQIGNSLRRESNREFTKEYEQEQRLTLVRRSEETYNTEAENSEQQYNGNYQWFDWMSVQRLHGERARANAAGEVDGNGQSVASDSSNEAVKLRLALEGKQSQDCPPGIRYSLASHPTEVVPL